MRSSRRALGFEYLRSGHRASARWVRKPRPRKIASGKKTYTAVTGRVLPGAGIPRLPYDGSPSWSPAGRPSAAGARRGPRLDHRQEALRGPAQVPVAAPYQGHRHATLQRGRVDDLERAQAQLLLHAALDEERDPEPRLHQPLLRGEAVDADDLRRLDAGRGEPLLQRGGEGLAPPAPGREGRP